VVCRRRYAVVVRHISSTVEPVEKVLFLTDGRLNSFKIATFLAHFDFSYSLVSNCQERRIRPMKSIIIAIALFFFIGCTHIVLRTGYPTENTNKSGNCDVKFLRDAPVDTINGKLLGKVRVTDSGFSFACGEDDALEIFRKEACRVGANTVNIIDEKRPDILSSCYRATALLISIQNVAGSPEIQNAYSHSADSTSVAKRVKEDHRRNATIIVCCILIGVMCGIMVPIIMMK